MSLPRNGKLLELARQHPTNIALAQHLGVPRSTLRDHIARLGMTDAVKSARANEGPERAGLKIDGDQAVLTSRPVAGIATPEDAIRARGLDPAEWEVKNLVVNEWDALGPGGEPRTMRQLKLYLSRRVAVKMVFPATAPDYVAPQKWRRDNGSTLVVLCGDPQAPYHDPKMHDLFRQWLARNRPHHGVLIGDTVDFPSISRHKDNPEWHVSTQECINAGYLLLRDYVRASEGTRWRKLLGNHDERIRNELLNRAERLYAIRPADIPGEKPDNDALSIRHLLRLDALGIELVQPNGNYTHAQVKINEKLIVRHGWLVGKNSAQASLKALSCSIVVGHTHKQRIEHRTVYDANGNATVLTGVETGCMCRIEAGLGYAVDPDWVNGFATASVWPDGSFHIDLAQYENGSLHWRKQKFS